MSMHRSDTEPPKPIPPDDGLPSVPADAPKDPAADAGLPSIPAGDGKDPANDAPGESSPTGGGNPGFGTNTAPQAPGPRRAGADSHPNATADGTGMGDSAPQAPGPDASSAAP